MTDTQTLDIETVIAERMAAQLAAHRAMIEAQIADLNASGQAEQTLYNETQQAIANTVEIQSQRMGSIREKASQMQKLVALRDQMFPPDTPAEARDTPPAEATAEGTHSP